MKVEVGTKAPDFSLYDTDKSKVALSNYAGKNVLLLFFPLAFTSTCTKELCSVRDNITLHNNTDATVLGISVDSLHTLAKYKEEQKALKATVKQNDSLAKLTTDLPFEGLKADDAKYNNVDKDKGERYKTWLKNLRKDIYVNEASNILKDMIGKPAGLATH